MSNSKRILSRIISAIIVVVLMATLFAGCAKKKDDSADENVTGNESTKEEVKKEPDELTAFLVIKPKAPEGVDPIDNYWLNMITEKANVKITDLEVPEWADSTQRFNLLLTSGQMPDFIIHSDRWSVNTFGPKGAFVPLQDYIKKSPVLSNWFPDEIWENSKAADGNLYNFFAKESIANNYVNYARIDLIDKLNGGVVPKTTEDWYEFAKKVKKNNPNAIPFISCGELYWQFSTFRAFGNQLSSANVAWREYDGEIYSPLGHPKMRECVEYHRKLYAEGLLDKEFVTTSSSDWDRKLATNDAILNTLKPNWVADMLINAKKAGNSDEIVWGPVPDPVAPGVDPKYVYWPANIRGYRAVSIPSSCKNVDAAIRLLEAFCDEDMAKEIIWGREGIEYKVENGKKVVNAAETEETEWRQCYTVMWQWQHPKALMREYDFTIEDLNKEGFDGNKVYKESIEPAYKLIDENNKVVGQSSTFFYIEEPDTQIMSKEGATLAKSIIVKAIAGQISMEEYDKQAAEFEKKYEKVTNEFKAWWEENNK
jgi:putative aldouronate transport system substrate-binding protein